MGEYVEGADTVEEDDLRDIISGAMAGDEDKDKTEPGVGAVEEDQESKVPASAGSAATKMEAEPDTQAAGVDNPVREEPATQDKHEATDDKAPSSWSPKVREKWASVDPEVRAEISRVHQASLHGVQQLHEQYAPVKSFAESLAPYMREIAQLGMSPAQHIHNTMAAERQLRSQDPASKLDALLSIADTYGIPIRQYVSGQQVPPQQAQQAQQPQQQLPPEVRELMAFKQQFERHTVEQQLAEVSGKEFFSDVQDAMADIIEMGRASSMTEAYDLACLITPDVKAILDERAAKAAQGEQLKQRQQAAARISGAGEEHGGIDVPGGNKDDSIRGLLTEALGESSGRI